MTMIQAITKFFRKEAVLGSAAVLAVVSMFFIKPDSGYWHYIDFRTIGLLFSLMTVMAGLRAMGIFHLLAQKLIRRAHTVQKIAMTVVLLCFFSSMVITNDVALITFVPFAIDILSEVNARKRDLVLTIVLQTIAANLGSMLTPIGNPQNLYLYSAAKISAADFIKQMLPYAVFALVLVIAASMLVTRQRVKPKPASGYCISRNKLLLYLILMGICLSSVARILPYGYAVFFVVLAVIVWDRQTLRKVDYSLLITFICLFILIGNIGRIPVFRSWISDIVLGHEMMVSVLISQLISNVPAAVLLTEFTDRYMQLIIGTNLGGLGTLIASMASLISYKYIVRFDSGSKFYYVVIFTLMNILILAFLCFLWYLLYV